MRKYFLILFFLLFIKSYLYSQVTFNNTIDFEEGDETAFSIVQVADGFVIGGHGYGFESDDFYEVKLKFTKIDFEGNVIWQKVFVDSGFNLYCGVQSGVYLSDGSVVFGGHRLTDSTSEIIIIKLNPDTGDSIFYKTYNFDDRIYGLHVRQLSNGELIMSAFDSNGSNGYLLLKLSINGDLIWYKEYGVSIEVAPSDFEIDTNDKIWIINKYLYCSPPGSLIREIDSDGIVVNQTFIPDYCLFAGIKSQIGGFYGPGGYYPIPPYETFTYRMDSLGQVLWVYETLIDFDTLASGELYTGVAQELPNGDLITIGYYGTPTGQYISIVSKVDPLGNSIWERYYTSVEENFSSRFTELALTPDSGILIIGVGYSEEDIELQNFWTLKLDSLGCLVPGCDTLYNGVFELPNFTSSVLVYPNPIAKNSIVRINTQQDISYKPSYFEIMDLIGNKILTNRIVNTVYTGNAWQFPVNIDITLSGLYILNIYSEDTKIGQVKISVK